MMTLNKCQSFTMSDYARQFIVPDEFGYGARCVLCSTGLMVGKKCVRKHSNGAQHKRKSAKHATLDQIRVLNSQIEQLGLPRWKHHVQATLMQYFLSPAENTSTTILDEARTILTKYEKMERLSLLELAVWKSSLQSDPFFETMDDLDAYWTLEKRFDPVAYKNERRVTSGISVIIQGVLPFLE